MKKPVILFIVLAALFVLTTCEKDEDKETRCRVIKLAIKYENNIDSILYDYDDEGQLHRSDLGGGYYTTYQYETNKVTERYYASDTLHYINVYTLSYNGYVMLSTHTLAGKDDPESSTTYDFDDNGYLISMVEVDESDRDDIQETTYQYQDGNLVYKEFEHSPDVYYSETTYEYYLDIPDKFNNKLPFLGKQNTNLVKKSTLVTEKITVVKNFSYQRNKAGYVLKEIETILTSTWEKEYTWDCN